MYNKEKIEQLAYDYIEHQKNEKGFFEELNLFAQIILKRKFRRFNLRQHSDDIIQEFLLSVWGVIKNHPERIKKAHCRGISYVNILYKNLQSTVYGYMRENQRIKNNELSYGLLEDLSHRELMGIWDDDEEEYKS